MLARPQIHLCRKFPDLILLSITLTVPNSQIIGIMSSHLQITPVCPIVPIGAIPKRLTCKICFEGLAENFVIPCGHGVCQKCLPQFLSFNTRADHRDFVVYHCCDKVLSRRTQLIFFGDTLAYSGSTIRKYNPKMWHILISLDYIHRAASFELPKGSDPTNLWTRFRYVDATFQFPLNWLKASVVTGTDSREVKILTIKELEKLSEKKKLPIGGIDLKKFKYGKWNYPHGAAQQEFEVDEKE